MSVYFARRGSDVCYSAKVLAVLNRDYFDVKSCQYYNETLGKINTAIWVLGVDWTEVTNSSGVRYVGSFGK